MTQPSFISRAMDNTAPAPAWLIELPTCPSTNDWALAHLDALAHGACVWTRRQTAGRGRGGARWQAPAGVLTASFVLDLADALDATRLSLAAGLAVCHAVEDLAPGIAVRLKWPNDCLIAGRKLAGILCERSRRAAREAVVVGIGLNLDPHWDQDPASLALAVGACPPIGLAEALDGKPAPTMPALLVALRRYLIEGSGVLAAGGWATLLPALSQRDWLRDRSVTLEAAGERVQGVGAGIDGEGGLLIDGAAQRRRFASAHVVAVGEVTSPRSAI